MAWQTVGSTVVGDARGNYGVVKLQYNDDSTGTSRDCKLVFELYSGASIYVYFDNLYVDGELKNSRQLVEGNKELWSGKLTNGNRRCTWSCPWYTGERSYAVEGYIPTGIVSPSTPSVSLQSKTYNSATFSVSISSYGVPADTSGRYIEAAILAQNSYGNSYRYATKSNATSGTITVNNSSGTGSTPLTIEGNHKYWYGGYASNTQASSSTVTGTFYTPCPPLSALSLSSQSYSTYNKVNAIIAYTRQADGGAETRTGYYRYSTNGGSSYSAWASFGTVSSTSGTFTASLPTSSSVTLQVKLSTPNGGDSTTKSVTFATLTTHTAPNFSNFTYEDSNVATVAITGNNQVFVQGQSQPKVTISKSNRATANDGLSITGYTASLNAQSIQIPYSSTASVSGTFPNNTPTAYGTLALEISAIDSVSSATKVSKNVTVVPWSIPQIAASASRENGFEATTTLSISGSYSPVQVNGTVKNSLTVEYRAKKSNEQWDPENPNHDWHSRSVTISGVNYSTTDLILSFDNEYSWDIEVRTTDTFSNAVVALQLPIGKPIFFFGQNNRCSINRKPQNSGADLDVEGKIYSQDQPVMVSHVGMVIMSTTLTTAADVKALYGGNWTAWSGISATGLYCWRRTS